VVVVCKGLVGDVGSGAVGAGLVVVEVVGMGVVKMDASAAGVRVSAGVVTVGVVVGVAMGLAGAAVEASAVAVGAVAGGCATVTVVVGVAMGLAGEGVGVVSGEVARLAGVGAGLVAGAVAVVVAVATERLHFSCIWFGCRSLMRCACRTRDMMRLHAAMPQCLLKTRVTRGRRNAYTQQLDLSQNQPAWRTCHCMQAAAGVLATSCRCHKRMRIRNTATIQ
jgi:hypothetical protein